MWLCGFFFGVDAGCLMMMRAFKLTVFVLTLADAAVLYIPLSFSSCSPAPFGVAMIPFPFCPFLHSLELLKIKS